MLVNILKKIWHNLIPILKQKASDIYLGKEPIIQMHFYVLFCQTDSSYFGMHWVHLVARKC